MTTVPMNDTGLFYKKHGFEVCGFSQLSSQYVEQCDACSDRENCQPVPMIFQFPGYRRQREVVTMPQFRILGSGAGTGVPSFFCSCPACQEARENPEYTRTRSGASVLTNNTMVLIDASPDLRSQLVKNNITKIDSVFLSHWHYDHFSGLGELEYYVKLDRIEKLPLYLPPSAVAQFESAFPNLLDIFNIIPWQFGQRYQFGEVCLTPLVANHSIETAGLLIESNEKRLAYFTDTSGLPEETEKFVSGADWLICDATFYGKNWYPHSHMSVEQAVELGRQVKAKETILTHLSMHYSQAVTTEALKSAVSRYPNVLVAHDGMVIEI